MKKRLRKKKKLGEFSQWGRPLLAYRNTEENREEFEDAFIEVVEKNKCFCGGVMQKNKIDVIIDLGGNSDEFASKFSQITEWLESRPDVDRWESGKLFDLWYGDCDENI